jgi:site-specific recombinase XerD
MSAEEIEKWLGDELASGLGPSSVHRHYRTLRRVLQSAVEKDRILANPCDRVRPPKVPRVEMAVLTWEQAMALAEAHSECFRPMIYLAIDTGMRWGELVGFATHERRPRPPQGARRRTARPAGGRVVGAAAAQDRCRRAHGHHLGLGRRDAG